MNTKNTKPSMQEIAVEKTLEALSYVFDDIMALYKESGDINPDALEDAYHGEYLRVSEADYKRMLHFRELNLSIINAAIAFTAYRNDEMKLNDFATELKSNAATAKSIIAKLSIKAPDELLERPRGRLLLGSERHVTDSPESYRNMYRSHMNHSLEECVNRAVNDYFSLIAHALEIAEQRQDPDDLAGHAMKISLRAIFSFGASLERN